MKKLLVFIRNYAFLIAFICIFAIFANAEIKSRSYTDVSRNDWFYEDLVKMSSLGIISGYPDNTFRPDDIITYAEFTTLVAKTLKYDYGKYQLKDEYHWATRYMISCVEGGAIPFSDVSRVYIPDNPIPRSYMAKMLVLALGVLPDSADNPFVDTSDIYAISAFHEYLIEGYLNENSVLVFKGSESLTRAEAVAVISRALDYGTDAYEYKKEKILNGYADKPYITESELLDLFYILNNEFITEYTFHTKVPFEKWQNVFLRGNILYPDVFMCTSYTTEYYSGENKYTIVLEYEDKVEKIIKKRDLAYAKAKEAVDTIIKPNMSDFEKISVIYDYIIKNSVYDYSNYEKDTIPIDSYRAFGLFIRKTAVCQGYCAAFNMMCNLAGIESATISGQKPGSKEPHVWNMVVVDGEIYFCDASSDDPVGNKEAESAYSFLCLTPKQFRELGYKWQDQMLNFVNFMNIY